MRANETRGAFSLIEIILALGIVAFVIFSGIMLLGDSLRKIQSLEQQNEYESGLAAVREYGRQVGLAGIQKAMDEDKPIAVVFYGAMGGNGSNWTNPVSAGSSSAPEFVGGLPQTTIVSNVTSVDLEKYESASRGSSYLVYFKLSPVRNQELGADETNGLQRALITQAKFYRFANVGVLASQLGAPLTNKQPDFVATLAIHP